MTSFTITGFSSVTQTLGTGETGLVTAGGTLATTGSAITVSQATVGESNIGIFGTVVSSALRAIASTGTLDVVSITVGAQGSAVALSNFSSINMTFSTSFELQNAGTISSNGLSAVFLTGASGSQTAQVLNTGVISAQSTAVQTNSEIESLVVSNSGTIFGAISHNTSLGTLRLSNDGIIRNAGTVVFSNGTVILDNDGTLNGSVTFGGTASIRNAGTINGSISDIVTSNAESSVTNSGRILGNITLSLGGDVIRNTGLIDGFLNMAGGANVLLNHGGQITGDVLMGTGGATLRNTGVIDGLVTAGAGNDTVTNRGTMGSVLLDAGSNTLNNLGLIDGSVTGGAGQDTIRNSGTISGAVALGAGDDIFDTRGGTALNQINGEDGNDSFIIDRGDLQITGGLGFDRITSTASTKIGLDVEFLELRGTTGLVGIGRSGSETFIGSDGDDTLRALAGDDLLSGGEGNDLLAGGAGNDRLVMDAGDDTLDGGSGMDTLALATVLRGVVNLATGTATFFDAGGAAVGTGVLSGIDNVEGSDLGDNITGSALANRLDGSLGDDTLLGGLGADDLIGDAGNDSLVGGGDNDVLTGGSGADTLVGAAGADRFVFTSLLDSAPSGADVITDFAVLNEIIDISAIDADTVAGGDQTFVFVGDAAFAGAGAQVRAFQDTGAGNTIIELRLAGSSVVDMTLTLTGLKTLTAANFDL